MKHKDESRTPSLPKKDRILLSHLRKNPKIQLPGMKKLVVGGFIHIGPEGHAELTENGIMELDHG